MWTENVHIAICLHNVSTKKYLTNIIARNTKLGIQAYISVKRWPCIYEINISIILGDTVSPHSVCCIRCPHNYNETRMCVCVCVCVCVCAHSQIYRNMKQKNEKKTCLKIYFTEGLINFFFKLYSTVSFERQP